MSGATAQEPVDGLRARKRAITTATIERVALELALEHGYDSITVDMICAASAVSPRTFFNYFGSKEGAVLGPAAPELSEQERASFVDSPGSDVLTDLAGLLAGALTGQGRDRELFASRRAVVVANPELMTKQVDRMHEQESRLVDLVLQRFSRQGRSTRGSSDLEDEARMVVTVMGAVLRFSARHWFDGGDPLDPIRMLHDDLALARRVVRHGD